MSAPAVYDAVAVASGVPERLLRTVTIDSTPEAIPVTDTSPEPLIAALPVGVTEADHVQPESKLVICTVKPSVTAVGVARVGARPGVEEVDTVAEPEV